jgi:hypothetical protein
MRQYNQRYRSTSATSQHMVGNKNRINHFDLPIGGAGIKV